MNLPNKITMVRIFIIPAIIIIYYIDELNFVMVSNITADNIIICLLFIVASISDFFDGYFARKYNLVTTFGKFADPLADKLLVMTALLILQDMNVVPMWIVLLILAREFIVTGIRLLAVEKGKVIAASKLGKYKTAFTMVAIIVLFFYQSYILILPLFNINIETLGMILLYISLGLTLISGVDYFFKNKEIITESI